jgi:hypothetical protein
MPQAQAARKDTLCFSCMVMSRTYCGLASPTLTSRVLHVLDSELWHDVIARQTFLPYIRNVELKCKMADLEVAMIENPMVPSKVLPVVGYIQSVQIHPIEDDHLMCWFEVEWSSNQGQLRIYDGTKPMLIGPKLSHDGSAINKYRYKVPILRICCSNQESYELEP